MGNVALYNYVNKLHIEILYLWVNIVILLDSNNEIKKIGVTAPLSLIVVIGVCLLLLSLLSVNIIQTLFHIYS